MGRSPLIILLSSLLFFALFHGKTLYRQGPTSPLGNVLLGLPTSKTAGSALWRALITGDDRGFSKEEKKTYYRLGLGHLFSPSGVHLATLNPLLKLTKHLPVVFAILAFMASLLPGLQALARVAWVKVIPTKSLTLSLFTLMMFLEGALLSWWQHPLSWTCSWLFLGMSWFTPKLWRPLWFMLAQMLLCWVLVQPFSLIAPFANLCAAIPLIFLFPTALVLSLVPAFFLHKGLVHLFDYFHSAVLWFDLVHRYLPPISPHAGHIILMAAWLTFEKRKRRWLPLFILVLSMPTGAIKEATPTLSKWEAVPMRGAYLLSVTKNKALWSDGLRCQRKLKGNRWEENCRPSRRKGDKMRSRKLSLNR